MQYSKSTSTVLALTVALTATQARAGDGPTLVKGGGTQSGGMLVVDQRGADFALPGGTTIHAVPGSELRVFPRAQKLELLPRQKFPTYSVILKSGRVDVSMPPPRGEPIAVLVSTSKDAGGIVMKGNFTAVTSRNRAAHANRDGHVLVKIGAGWKPLDAGFEQTLIGGTDSRITPLLDAPHVSGRFLRLAFGDKGAKVDDIKWEPVKGARSYQVALSGGAKPVSLTVTSTRLPESLRTLAPGVYSLGVRAVDADGMEGRAWTVAQLNIVSATVPDGSLVDAKGTMYLAPHAEVRLANIAGLEMGLDKSRLFSAAAPSVGLYREEPTTVVLRRPTDKQSLELVLKPRGVEADVTLGPATAVWPRDWIDIDVRVRGPKGAALDTIEAKPHVTLGVDELDLKWSGSAHRMHARVHPRAGVGPWVLRVEVTDQHGILLGRNFVEIAQEARISRAE